MSFLKLRNVDLEQREGRVHRYKNHAVRLNLAANFKSALQNSAQRILRRGDLLHQENARREQGAGLLGVERFDV